MVDFRDESMLPYKQLMELRQTCKDLALAEAQRRGAKLRIEVCVNPVNRDVKIHITEYDT